MVWTHKLDKVFLLVNNTIVKFPPLSLMLHKFSLELNLYVLQFASRAIAVWCKYSNHLTLRVPRGLNEVVTLQWEEWSWWVSFLWERVRERESNLLFSWLIPSVVTLYIMKLSTFFFVVFPMEFCYFLTGILFDKTFWMSFYTYVYKPSNK